MSTKPSAGAAKGPAQGPQINVRQIAAVFLIVTSVCSLLMLVL